MRVFYLSTPLQLPASVSSASSRRLQSVAGHLRPAWRPRRPSATPVCASGERGVVYTTSGRVGEQGRSFQTGLAPKQQQQQEPAAMSSSVPTAAELGKLEKVLNARDLAEAYSQIKPGRLFRSGTPAHASLQDVLVLRRELGVQQMIDFRSSEERREDSAWSLMLSNGTIRTYAEGQVMEVCVDHNAALVGIELEDISLHQLPLLEKSSFVWGLMRKLPYASLLTGLFWKAVGHEERLKAALLPEINRGGLQLIYEILMETSQPDICKALQLMAEGAKARRPQLFFCKLGKDRTGLLAALVLSACGASEDEIVADYARSDGVDAIALGGLEKDKDMQGIDSHIFSRAPPEAMRQLLQYARQRYGGMQQYMKLIGFSREQQQQLAASLTSDEEW